MARILGWKCIRITLYPYGGCSQFDVDINIPLWQELLVLIMGPITQIVFIYIIKYFVDTSNYILFERYSRWILYFNMLPIYPLDGGKLINLILCRFISYYYAFQITIYISYFLFLSCFLTIIFLDFNLVLFLIFILLGVTLLKEMKKSLLYYQRFLYERYLNDYSFKRIKKIEKLKEMKRGTFHMISNVSEKEYLHKYFTYI